MIIQCPRCSTRWRIADPEESDNPIFKCGRCHHVFHRFPGAPTIGERSSRHRGVAPPEPDNLEFIFPRRAAVRTAPEAPLQPSVLETEASPEPFDQSEPLIAADAELDSDERYRLGDDGAPLAPAPSLTLQEENSMNASPIYRLLFAMVACFGLMTLAARSDPERASDWLARLPVVGPRLSERSELGRQIMLRNVHGSYQRLHNARRGFVVSGEAVNNSLSAVERIEVEAALYDAGGEVDRKIVITGNKATLRLAELSERAISMLQDFDPHATLAPGDSMPFWVVFLEPPADVKEFSSRVRSVRPTGQASTPPPDRTRNPASVG